MACFLYILQSQIRETYYSGVSDDALRRGSYHNGENKGYTQRYRPWKVAYTKPFPSRKQALAAERIVKAWKSKKMIRLLIQGKIHIEDYMESNALVTIRVTNIPHPVFLFLRATQFCSNMNVVHYRHS